ncbi:MAG: tetratricopeptide repeat protein [Holophagales bacterium]|nr:tetratricopeptide repeat protein [Holophagales bacterium]
MTRVPATQLSLALLLVGVAALALAADPPPYNLDRAIEAQNQLTIERPEDPAVWNDLGNLLTLKKHYDKAEVSYRKAIELDPEPASPHFNLALLLERRDEHRAALKELEIVVEKEPEHAWAHYQIGTIYQRWGRDGRAVRSYARAFRFDPSLAEARINPHVLDNPLIERALLEAHANASDALLPPRTYEEPSRIAALMIDVPATPPGETEQAAAPATEAGGFARPTGGSGGPPRFDVQSEEPSSEESESRKLTSSDLEPNREVNQVVGGATVGGGVRATPGRPSGGTGATPGRPFAGRFRPGASQNPGPGAPPTETKPVPSFQPSTDSTGRLELRLLPAAPSAS